jgi:hypothetical protein
MRSLEVLETTVGGERGYSVFVSREDESKAILIARFLKLADAQRFAAMLLKATAVY